MSPENFNRLCHLHLRLVNLRENINSKNETGFSVNTGICQNVAAFSLACAESLWLHSKFKIWHKFSGSVDYPISVYWDRSDDIANADFVASSEYFEAADKWYSGGPHLYSPETEYGKLRLELLDFLIKEAERDIDHYEKINNENFKHF